jgi:hypothetical protein
LFKTLNLSFIFNSKKDKYPEDDDEDSCERSGSPTFNPSSLVPTSLRNKLASRFKEEEPKVEAYIKKEESDMIDEPQKILKPTRRKRSSEKSRVPSISPSNSGFKPTAPNAGQNLH